MPPLSPTSPANGNGNGNGNGFKTSMWCGSWLSEQLWKDLRTLRRVVIARATDDEASRELLSGCAVVGNACTNAGMAKKTRMTWAGKTQRAWMASHAHRAGFSHDAKACSVRPPLLSATASEAERLLYVLTRNSSTITSDPNEGASGGIAPCLSGSYTQSPVSYE